MNENEIGTNLECCDETNTIQQNHKSNCTASLQKGYETGGGESGGSSENLCDEIFFPVGLNLLSTHRRFQINPIFGANYCFWLRK